MTVKLTALDRSVWIVYYATSVTPRRLLLSMLSNWVIGEVSMGREQWEVWHDDYQDYWEGDRCIWDYAEEYHEDDISKYKEERDQSDE
jgi:hypothetical protein